MLLAIDCPNMWLNGSRLRNRSGWNGQAYLRYYHHLAFHRDDVGQHVAMANDDALRLGRRARCEDDLNDVVARDRHGWHRAVGAPVEIGHQPDNVKSGFLTAVALAKVVSRTAHYVESTNIVTGENHRRADERLHFEDEVGR
jgi:hypothetical protein